MPRLELDQAQSKLKQLQTIKELYDKIASQETSQGAGQGMSGKKQATPLIDGVYVFGTAGLAQFNK